MPWNLPTAGATGSIHYVLPPGLTGIGTVGQILIFLLDSYNFPKTDPGITGAVWNNNLTAAISKGATGP